jgi:hypothetical protein
MIVKNKPIPQPIAVVSERGMSLTTHCRSPKMVRAKKIIPSRKTAAKASL